jgi:GAF domain-containing protein
MTGSLRMISESVGKGAANNAHRSTQPDSNAHADLEQAARSGDVKGVLARLNARTRYRFTGLYRVEEPTLRNICLFDRENPDLAVSGAVCGLEDTYCSITCATECGFTTEDARTDPRLEGHSARLQVVSYAGVPVTLGEGIVGTLCHFDFRPRLLSTGEIPFLQSVSPLLAEFLTSPRGL